MIRVCLFAALVVYAACQGLRNCGNLDPDDSSAVSFCQIQLLREQIDLMKTQIKQLETITTSLNDSNRNGFIYSVILRTVEAVAVMAATSICGYLVFKYQQTHRLYGVRNLGMPGLDESPRVRSRERVTGDIEQGFPLVSLKID